jgi:hypothetical protein
MRLMRLRYRFITGCSLLLLLWPPQAPAQQPAAPTLEQILARVRQNYEAYLRTVPNLFADESLSSGIGFPEASMGSSHGFASGRQVSYGSVFRLKRTGIEDDTPVLQETRQIVSVDHRPATSQQSLLAPDMVVGAFSYAPDVLLSAFEQCYDYKLQPSRRWQGRDVVVVQYASTRGLKSVHVRCPIAEPHSGRVLIDSASMQIVRFEQARARHAPSPQTIQSFSLSPESYGNWTWSIDYAPVRLEGRSFWLPKTITSKFEVDDNATVIWSSASSYSNYHLLDVHSTILPAGIVPAP